MWLDWRISSCSKQWVVTLWDLGRGLGLKIVGYVLTRDISTR
jgi:hypothetical protein